MSRRPARGGGGGRGGGAARTGAAAIRTTSVRHRVDYAEEFTRRRGNVTAATLEKIKQFVDEGGTVLAIGGASEGAISLFKLPLANHLVNRTERPDRVLRAGLGAARRGRSEEPARARLRHRGRHLLRQQPGVEDRTRQAGSGLKRAASRGSPTPTPLRSGWAWGQKFLDKGIQIVEANVGKGRVFVFGNDLIFRTQPHGNYKFFFNGLYLSVADGMKAGIGAVDHWLSAIGNWRFR